MATTTSETLIQVDSIITDLRVIAQQIEEAQPHVKDYFIAWRTLDDLWDNVTRVTLKVKTLRRSLL
jgi:hypothetical protein